MTKTEVAKLLTVIAAFDRRTLGESDVEAWHLILADLDAQDCADAVKHHYANRRDWLMPADVRTFAVNAARRREGQRRQAEREAEIAAENPALECKPRPVAAITVGQRVPTDDPVRIERRRALRAAAHSKRAAVEADVHARTEHQAARAQAEAELERVRAEMARKQASGE